MFTYKYTELHNRSCLLYAYYSEKRGLHIKNLNR